VFSLNEKNLRYLSFLNLNTEELDKSVYVGRLESILRNNQIKFCSRIVPHLIDQTGVDVVKIAHINFWVEIKLISTAFLLVFTFCADRTSTF
jgi:hypothetical protein